MIQLKTPYTYVDRAISVTGTLQVEIVSWNTIADAKIVEIQDFIISDSGAKQLINSRQKRMENLEVNQLADLIAMDNDFSGLTKTEKDWKEAQLALFIFVKNDLVDSIHTIYGMIPSDWKLSE